MVGLRLRNATWMPSPRFQHRERLVNREEWESTYLRLRRNLKTRKRRIEFFAIGKEKRVLDIGCGDGLDLLIFQRLGYRHICGLDISERLLQRIDGFDNICADAHHMPIESHSFDVVFGDNIIHHLNAEESLAEIKRILRPGGELCLIEPASSLCRRVLDAITFSPLSRLFSSLRFRGNHLREEWPLYSTWLQRERAFPSLLKRCAFEVILYQRTPLTVFIKCRST